MQKAVNRFWNWLFHPSILRYNNPKGKAILFRYPTPGNGSIDNAQADREMDYKTPYQHSKYDVRYQKPIPQQLEEQTIKIVTTAILKKYGLLQPGQQTNPQAVMAAKKVFQLKYANSADTNIWKDSLDLPIDPRNREVISSSIQSIFQGLKETKKETLDYSSMKKTIDNPEIVPLESVDMFVTPHFQQQRINNQYALDMAVNQIDQKKKIDVYVGNANFWKAIDDSFAKEEVEKLQRHVGDQDPTNFELKKSKIEYQFSNDGKYIVDVHPKF